MKVMNIATNPKNIIPADEFVINASGNNIPLITVAIIPHVRPNTDSEDFFIYFFRLCSHFCCCQYQISLVYPKPNMLR